jgi:hypothetical protein
MIKDNFLNNIFVFVLQLTILKNAVSTGWRIVEYNKNQIIIRKKIENIETYENSRDNDINHILNSLIAF